MRKFQNMQNSSNYICVKKYHTQMPDIKVPAEGLVPNYSILFYEIRQLL